MVPVAVTELPVGRPGRSGAPWGDLRGTGSCRPRADPLRPSWDTRLSWGQPPPARSDPPGPRRRAAVPTHRLNFSREWCRSPSAPSPAPVLLCFGAVPAVRRGSRPRRTCRAEKEHPLSCDSETRGQRETCPRLARRAVAEPGAEPRAVPPPQSCPFVSLVLVLVLFQRLSNGFGKMTLH